MSHLSKIIGLLQIDSTVGDLSGNAERLESLTAIAQANGAQVAIATELAVCGYPPRDLLLQPDFITTSFETAKNLAVEIPVLVGTPIPPDHERNLPANGVVRAGVLQAVPNKDNTNRVVAKYGQDPVASLAEWGRQGVSLDATVNLSASPYHADKVGSRIKVCRTAAEILHHPFLLANQVGGNDDLLFDGCSLVAWPDGRVVVAPAWQEGVLLVDLAVPENCQWIAMGEADAFVIGKDEIKFLNSEADGFEESTEIIEDITDAVIAGLADYCRKSGIKRIVLGLSGGIDSAVAACVACAAVGPTNVLGIAMPSRFSSQHSLDDAKYTAEALGMEFKIEPIDGMHTALEGTIGEVLDDGNPVASENIQSRLRGIIVMAHANAQNRMAIATGNKSELAQGYCTLYGDMAGGYTPLGDLYKMQGYALAEIFNQRAIELGDMPPVNESTMTKPPSAELAPDQKDEDSLPPYEILDEILRLHIEHTMDADDIVAAGYERSIVVDVLSRLERNEHKRWQMSPAPRVTSKAFGQGWRRPLASRHDWRD